MATRVTIHQAGSRLAELCDLVTNSNKTVIIHRQGAEDVALVSARELSGLIETIHLLRSPRNAERLLRALASAEVH